MPKITLFQVGVVLCGALLALYVFMSGAIQAWIKGGTSWRSAQPEVLNWPLFLLALLLMSDPPFIAQAQGHAKGESPGSGYLDSSLQRFQKDYVSRSRHAIHTFPAFHKMEALIENLWRLGMLRVPGGRWHQVFDRTELDASISVWRIDQSLGV